MTEEYIKILDQHVDQSSHKIPDNNEILAPASVVKPKTKTQSFLEQLNPEDPKAAEKEYAKANPTKRLGVPEEVAKVVAFLLSEDCSYVNGQTIAIDGGQSNSYGNV